MSERYAFIEAKKATRNLDGTSRYSVAKMCAWLEVSRSGYYAWRDRPASATQKRRDYLKLLIGTSFTESDGTYGYRRVHEQLGRWGVSASPQTVRALMRQLQLVACQPRPWRPSLTEQDGRSRSIPDLVMRDFTAESPGEKMVGDVTYIPTWEGWVYLATVIDCATRKIIGWAMGDNYRTPLVAAAVQMAARTIDLPNGAIFHSDRGSNYTSGEFGAELARLGIRQSVGRTGICFDNALSESVNAAIKVERVNRTVYPTRRKAIADVARYIEIRYNRKRLHSGLGYRTPQEVYDEYLNRQDAA